MIRRKSTRGAWPDILALMAPEAAQRLTVELATRAHAAAKGGPGDLPKIEGRPTTPEGRARKAPARRPTGAWLAPFQSEWNKIPLASEPAGC
jgi:hypothetical protein